ncbi:MAG: SDR family oxidoreductase [Halobacteriales archaeon]|nr:SDR family oxidoreductase [Halobacteriales archaeon]
MATGDTDDSTTETESVEPPEITTDAIHHVDDPYFTERNVAIVTGGASGIGQATAVALAANGLTVIATDVDESGLEETRDIAETVGAEGTIVAVPGDLSVDDDIETIVTTAADHGEIKYLANIAGLQHIDSIAEFPMEQYDLMHDVMLRAPLYLTKLAWPHIEASEDGVGAIGNMASVHGHYVTHDKVAYNIVKFGIRGLTQSIAAEGDGAIRGFSISTGYVKTPLVTDQIPDTADQRGISVREVIEDVMLGQARAKEMMEPIDVGNLFTIGFSELGQHLNGGDLPWDGGMMSTYE